MAGVRRRPRGRGALRAGVGTLTSLEPVAISVREVARRLDISKSHAHRLVTTGEIPGFRVGSNWRVLVREFDAYIERQRAAAEERYQRARAARPAE